MFHRFSTQRLSNKYSKISPHSDIFIQTPLKENYFVIHAFGSDQSNRIQKVFYSKMELGSCPSQIEMLNLNEPILNEEALDKFFVKVGRYSNTDVIANRKNYVAFVNASGRTRDEQLLTVLPIK